MVRAAPLVSFTVTSIDYGTIDVGASSARRYYDIYLQGTSTTYTEAINMSISFRELTNASEARSEEWVKVSCPNQIWTTIGSVSTGTDAFVSTVIAGTRSGAFQGLSIPVATVISVPSGAATAGAVTFYLHHRYQYTGDDDDYASDY